MSTTAIVPSPARAEGRAEIPLSVRNNRIYASFDVPTPAGQRESVEFMVDTGGGALVIARKTADVLGFKPLPPKLNSPFAPISLDAIYLRDIRVPIGSAFTTVANSDRFSPGSASAGFLAGAFLGDHIVTFDYLRGALALDGPPVENGITLPVLVDQQSGFPRVELEIDGEKLGFLLDTGASFTMLSQSVVDRLRSKYPHWAYRAGAYGSANMMGGSESHGGMLRIPDARWGAFALPALDVVSRPTGTFETYMSKISAGPIVGALGGNALRNFVLRLDYPNATLSARFEPRQRPDELTTVPLILTPNADGTYTVSGSTLGELTGKRLLKVDGRPVEGLSMDDVLQRLRGTVGSTHVIEVSDVVPVHLMVVSIL